jgi:hypothetical protein
LGGFIAISLGAVHFQKTPDSKWEQLHRLFFIAFMLYMIFQSLYGSMELGELRKIRWPASFAMIGLLSLVGSFRGFPLLSKKKLALIIVTTGLVYFFLYIMVGVVYELIAGMGIWVVPDPQYGAAFSSEMLNTRWLLQNYFWGGTTYAFFPLILILPALFFLIKDANIRYKQLGWITLIAVTVSALYYESRLALMVIIPAFFMVSMYTYGFRKSLPILLILLIVLGVFMKFVWADWETANFWKSYVMGTYGSIWNPLETADATRFMHFLIGPSLISSNWKIFLFGYGFRTSGPIIAKSMSEIIFLYRGVNAANNYAFYSSGSTVGFTTLLVETGMIGILLLGANILFVARKIIIQGEAVVRRLLLLALFFLYFWLFITNPVDIVLFYLMIMPSGLLIQLSEYKLTENGEERKALKRL